MIDVLPKFSELDTGKIINPYINILFITKLIIH